MICKAIIFDKLKEIDCSKLKIPFSTVISKIALDNSQGNWIFIIKVVIENFWVISVDILPLFLLSIVI